MPEVDGNLPPEQSLSAAGDVWPPAPQAQETPGKARPAGMSASAAVVGFAAIALGVLLVAQGAAMFVTASQPLDPVVNYDAVLFTEYGTPLLTGLGVALFWPRGMSVASSIKRAIAALVLIGAVLWVLGTFLIGWGVPSGMLRFYIDFGRYAVVCLIAVTAARQALARLDTATARRRQRASESQENGSI